MSRDAFGAAPCDALWEKFHVPNNNRATEQHQVMAEHIDNINSAAPNNITAN